MKTKPGKTNQVLAMIFSLVLVMGFCFSGPAAGETRPWKKQENTQRIPGVSNLTASPAPVVDDSPINPDTAGKKRAGDASKRQKNSNQDNQKVPKKFNPHRLW